MSNDVTGTAERRDPPTHRPSVSRSPSAPSSWCRCSCSCSRRCCPATSPSACSGASRPRSSDRSSATTCTSTSRSGSATAAGLGGVVRGDLGTSLVNDETVTSTIGVERQEHALPRRLRVRPLPARHADPRDAGGALPREAAGRDHLAGHADRALAARVRARDAADLRVRGAPLVGAGALDRESRRRPPRRGCTRPCCRRSR